MSAIIIMSQRLPPMTNLIHLKLKHTMQLRNVLNQDYEKEPNQKLHKTQDLFINIKSSKY